MLNFRDRQALVPLLLAGKLPVFSKVMMDAMRGGRSKCFIVLWLKSPAGTLLVSGFFEFLSQKLLNAPQDPFKNQFGLFAEVKIRLSRGEYVSF